MKKASFMVDKTFKKPYLKLQPFKPDTELYKFIDVYLQNANKESLLNEITRKQQMINRISPFSLLDTFKGFVEYKAEKQLIKECIFKNITEPMKEEILLKPLSEYYFNLSGKMIRPHFIIQLSKYLYECLDGDSKDFFDSKIFKRKIIPLAACMESMHNASLLQDDIIDNSETRRGNPTAHCVYGIKPTIFASNYILTKGANLISDIGIPHLNEIYSGIIYDLIYGEYQQTIKKPIAYNDNINDIRLNLEKYIIKTYYKTASLISSSFRGIAIVFELDINQQRKLFNLGLHLGQLFQLVDDIFDVEGDSSQLKKPAYKDLNEGVINCHILFELLDKNNKEMMDLINMKFQGDNSLRRVLEILDEGCGLVKTKNLALDHLLETFKIMEDPFFKETETKKKIQQGIIYMFNRKY